MDYLELAKNSLAVIDSIPHRVFTKDRKFIYTFVNRAFANDFGMEVDEIIGLTDFDIHSTSEAQKIRKDDTAVLEGSADVDIIEVTERNDRIFTGRTIKHPLRNKEGDVVGIMGIFWDISGEIQNSSALATSQGQLRMALQGTDIGTWSWLEKEQKLFWDQQCARIYGITGRNEGDKEYFLNLVHPEDRPDVLKAVTGEADGTSILEMEYRIRRSDGTTRFVMSRGERHYDSDGALTGINGITMDVSKRHRTEEALRSILAMNAEMNQSTQKEIIQLGLEESVRLTESRIGFFHLFNEETGEIHLQRWSKDTMKMCEVPDLSKHYDLNAAGIWADCIREKKPVIHNSYADAVGKKGLPEGHFPLEREMTVPILEQGKVVAIIGVGNKYRKYNDFDVDQLSLLGDNIWNIISRKRTESALEKARDEAMEANQVKDKFFSIIAHDLTNPFSNIRILAEQLEMFTRSDDTELASYAELSKILSRTVSNAQDLLKDLLTWSRSQRNAISYTPVLMQADEAAKVALAACLPMAETKGVNLEQDWNGAGTVFADRDMLQTILRNLLTNAVKFTSRGGTVGIRIANLGKKVRYDVSDDGIGIPKDQMKNLFAPGAMSSTRGTNMEKGTGLGLTLCKEFVDKHQGDIFVESTEGNGSTFSVILRSETSAAAEDSAD